MEISLTRFSMFPSHVFESAPNQAVKVTRHSPQSIVPGASEATPDFKLETCVLFVVPLGCETWRSLLNLS